MFSSSNNNGSTSSDCFGAQSGFISPSSFQQFGSSFSPLFFEEDHFFVTAHILAMFQGQDSFLLGHDEGNPNNHGFMDGVMVDEQMSSYDHKVMEEEVGSNGKNQPKGNFSLINDNQNNEKLLKRSAKRIRTVKKERHSKINTAKGPRDRRMRLSLHIARKFFDLQDKLGFDKASKTIEWLFSMSNNAIKEVMGCSRMDEHMSYIDIGKCTNTISSDIGWKNHLVVPQSNDEIDHKTYDYEDCTKVNDTNKKLRITHVPKWTQMRKDIRAKARARARERTLKKMTLKTLKDPNHGSSLATSSHCFSEHIDSCNTFEYVDSLPAQCQSFEDQLIHERWEEIQDARLYSCYMFHDTNNTTS